MNLGNILKQIMDERKISLRMLEKMTGVSKSALGRYISGDTKKIPVNYITKIANALGIDPVELLGGDNTAQPRMPSNILTPQSLQTQRVPLLGEVAAGQPVYCDQGYNAYVTSPIDCDAALEIHGDSMSPTYMDGDIIFIKCTPEALRGSVAVVIIDDTAVVKHVYQDGPVLKLVSDNPEYEPMYVSVEEHEYVHIFGVPVGYTRIYHP